MIKYSTLYKAFTNTGRELQYTRYVSVRLLMTIQARLARYVDDCVFMSIIKCLHTTIAETLDRSKAMRYIVKVEMGLRTEELVAAAAPKIKIECAVRIIVQSN